MNGSRFKPRVTSLSFCAASTLLLLLLPVGPAPVFAQDDDSVAALRQIGRTFARIAEKASPAVVAITVEKSVTGRQPGAEPWWLVAPQDRSRWLPPEAFSDDLFARLEHREPSSRSPIPRARQGSRGTGFIVSDDGHILTNHHIVAEARKIGVGLADGRHFEASVIGSDPETDVAVLKIDADGLSPLSLGDSDALEVGDWVVGFANGLGMGHTFAPGLVTAKGRSDLGLATYEDFIQTNLNLGLGDGGGPLLDLDGKVVGINTAAIRAERASGISLAIPVNMAKTVYEQIAEEGAVERGFLGVLPQDIDAEMAEALGLEIAGGVIISEVIGDSPAEKAGIKDNDVILELDGASLRSAKQLLHSVAALRPGRQVEVVVFRDGERKTLTVTLGKRPWMPDSASGNDTNVFEKLGLDVQDLSPDLAQQLGYEGQTGVVVTKVKSGSQAERAGLTAGALIEQVNRKAVRNTAEFKRAIADGAGKGAVLLLVRHKAQSWFVVLKVQ
jgi:serine protease Do